MPSATIPLFESKANRDVEHLSGTAIQWRFDFPNIFAFIALRATYKLIGKRGMKPEAMHLIDVVGNRLRDESLEFVRQTQKGFMLASSSLPVGDNVPLEFSLRSGIKSG